MDKLTLGQIAVALAFIVGIGTSIGWLAKHLKAGFAKVLNEQLSTVKQEIKDVSKKVDNVDMESCKNYLVTFLSGVERGNNVDEIERERFYEQYQHYTNIGGNSYIKRKIEQLKTAGKL